MLTTARNLYSAELLKLRRQRPLIAFVAFLTIGSVVIFMGYLQLRHASNPSQYGSPGGALGLAHLLRDLGVFFGALAAVLVGTEAGTADLSSGVFRDLVATGRSRLQLFMVRLPAALTLSLGFTLAAYALGIVAVFAFAGGMPTPTAGQILDGAAWLALADLVVCGLAVAVGSVTGSRALTLTAVIGLQTIATQLIIGVPSLGFVRELLINSALSQLVPLGAGNGVQVAEGTAVAVLIGWVLLPALAGAWRTVTRDA
jgi:hypothetical protein